MKRFAALELARTCSGLFQLNPDFDKAKTMQIVKDFTNEKIRSETAIDYFNSCVDENTTVDTWDLIKEAIRIIENQ